MLHFILAAAISAGGPYMMQSSRLGRFSGVVLAARGAEVYREAFGYADAVKRVPNNVNTQFEIASLTKMFTAAAILKLRDDGRLQLSDSVCSYRTSGANPALMNRAERSEIFNFRSAAVRTHRRAARISFEHRNLPAIAHDNDYARQFRYELAIRYARLQRGGSRRRVRSACGRRTRDTAARTSASGFGCV